MQRIVQACHVAMAEVNAVDYTVTLAASTGVIPDIVVSGGLALAPMSFAGSVTPARKQVISWQLFLFAVITLITFAAPAVVLTSNLPADMQTAILTYDALVAAYTAAYARYAIDKR